MLDNGFFPVSSSLWKLKPGFGSHWTRHLNVKQASPLWVLPGLDTSPQQHWGGGFGLPSPWEALGWSRTKERSSTHAPQASAIPQWDILRATLLLPLATSLGVSCCSDDNTACSKAALAPMAQLQRQNKALVMPWLMEKIRLYNMAFLSLP